MAGHSLPQVPAQIRCGWSRAGPDTVARVVSTRSDAWGDSQLSSRPDSSTGHAFPGSGFGVDANNSGCAGKRLPAAPRSRYKLERGGTATGTPGPREMPCRVGSALSPSTELPTQRSPSQVCAPCRVGWHPASSSSVVVLPSETNRMIMMTQICDLRIGPTKYNCGHLVCA